MCGRDSAWLCPSSGSLPARRDLCAENILAATLGRTHCISGRDRAARITHYLLHDGAIARLAGPRGPESRRPGDQQWEDHAAKDVNRNAFTEALAVPQSVEYNRIVPVRCTHNGQVGRPEETNAERLRPPIYA
jgi:hypothetical protein